MDVTGPAERPPAASSCGRPSAASSSLRTRHVRRCIQCWWRWGLSPTSCGEAAKEPPASLLLAPLKDQSTCAISGGVGLGDIDHILRRYLMEKNTCFCQEHSVVVLRSQESQCETANTKLVWVCGGILGRPVLNDNRYWTPPGRNEGCAGVDEEVKSGTGDWTWMLSDFGE